MISGLTVITHTKKSFNRDISKCIQSVKDALPERSKHIVIELSDSLTHVEFQQARLNALALGDIVVFVDDDDYISQESLSLCLHALTDTNAGLAFTDEMQVRNGHVQPTLPRDITYDTLCMHPQAVHHMAALRTSTITHRTVALTEKYNCGVEWIMKAEAAISAGAIHIPHCGYFWVQHVGQYSMTPDVQKSYRDNMFLISKELRMWNNRTGNIPTWKT